MSYLDTALSVAGGLGRAYGGYRTGGQRAATPGFGAPYGAQGPVAQAPQQQQGGLLMQYLRNRARKPGSVAPGHEQVTDMQPNESTSPDPGMIQGGMQVPMGPTPPVAGPPAMPVPYPRPPMPQGDQNSGSGMAANGQAFAQGGVVDKPTTAIIGEDGPEMVIPLSGRADAKVSPRNIPQMNYGRR